MRCLKLGWKGQCFEFEACSISLLGRFTNRRDSFVPNHLHVLLEMQPTYNIMIHRVHKGHDHFVCLKDIYPDGMIFLLECHKLTEKGRFAKVKCYFSLPEIIYFYCSSKKTLYLWLALHYLPVICMSKSLEIFFREIKTDRVQKFKPWNTIMQN